MKHRKNARFPAVQYRLPFIGFLWTRPVDKQRFQGYTLPDEIRDPQRIRRAPEKGVEVDTMRRYANLAVAYAVAAMAAGVFYREFTKFSQFTGKTSLSVMHTHYFMLGMFFFLVLMLAEKAFAFSDKSTGKLVVFTGLAFLARGFLQVRQAVLTKAVDASISGIAGIGHIVMGISLVLILLKIRRHAV